MMTRFCAYIDKVYDFGDWVAELHDHRLKPRILTAGIWTSVFFMFVTHRESLNALESELRVPRRFDGLVGSHKPSADRIGDVFCLVDPEELRTVLSGVNHQLGRNKVLKRQEGWRFAVVDGHEFFSQPTPLLQGMLSTEGHRQRRGGHRILPPGCRLSSGGI
jgi:hypothetical protein